MTSSSPLRRSRVRLALTAVILGLATSAASSPATAVAAVCDDFSTQEEAQRVFDGNRTGNRNLDTNRNGVACENLSGNASPVLAQTGFPAWLFIAGAVVLAGGAIALRRRRPRRDLT